MNDGHACLPFFGLSSMHHNDDDDDDRAQQQQQQESGGGGGEGGVMVGEAEGESADALVERLGGAMDYTPGAGGGALS